jgi:hypothetical protein
MVCARRARVKPVMPRPEATARQAPLRPKAARQETTTRLVPMATLRETTRLAPLRPIAALRETTRLAPVRPTAALQDTTRLVLIPRGAARPETTTPPLPVRPIAAEPLATARRRAGVERPAAQVEAWWSCGGSRAEVCAARLDRRLASADEAANSCADSAGWVPARPRRRQRRAPRQRAARSRRRWRSSMTKRRPLRWMMPSLIHSRRHLFTLSRVACTMSPNSCWDRCTRNTTCS